LLANTGPLFKQLVITLKDSKIYKF